METKTRPLSECEIKSSNDGWTFEGYASKFNGVDSYNDTIHEGAYEKTLKERALPVFMRFEHKSGGLPPGKWTHLSEDSEGLYVQGELTRGMALASDIRAAMQHETIQHMSIGYQIPKGGAEEKDGIRHLREIKLIEISLVQNPADTAAVVTGIKAEIEALEGIKEFEYFLRDAGNMSAAAAKCYISRLKSFVSDDVCKQYDEEIKELKRQIAANISASHYAKLIKEL